MYQICMRPMVWLRPFWYHLSLSLSLSPIIPKAVCQWLISSSSIEGCSFYAFSGSRRVSDLITAIHRVWNSAKGTFARRFLKQLRVRYDCRSLLSFSMFGRLFDIAFPMSFPIWWCWSLPGCNSAEARLWCSWVVESAWGAVAMIMACWLFWYQHLAVA